jgi:hypothetical protein
MVPDYATINGERRRPSVERSWQKGREWPDQIACNKFRTARKSSHSSIFGGPETQWNVKRQYLMSKVVVIEPR